MNTQRFRTARIGALAVLLTALVAGAASAVANHFVPLRGSAAGSVVGVAPTPEGLLEFTIVASGHATQLGHFDRVERLFLDPGTGAFTGSIRFVAANSDVLDVTMVGAFAPPLATGTYTVAGGSGRFAGATGSAAFQAFTPDLVQMSARFDGLISTVGG
jgi:hypothetical protein